MTESRQTRLQVKCPTCQTTVVWKPENAFRPFCSQRCKLIDLGGWADGKYAV
ncbi:DNA gyrase inhibitor YacG, partial [Klebsiella pneumoniae]|nr:DNA gyrase inhibitor YacG [Klebsiella pneumoniae]